VVARTLAFAAAAAAALIILAACGGGGGSQAGPGQRITDPTRVPTATPLSGDAPLYRIQGDVVQAPSGTTTVVAGRTPASTGSTHTVVSGDTCGAIATRYGITTAELRAANRAINEGCTNLVPGQELRIPGGAGGGSTGAGTAAPTATPRPGGTRTYTVKSGDNCYDIGQSFGVTEAAIIAANGLDAECRSLRVGQELIIP
jgi:LysM repeat protein